LVALVITGVAGLTVNTKFAVPDPFALVADIEAVALPADVGVPLICPVVVLTASPAGSPVALKLVGPFVAVIV
jgi:hypothetical protein